MDEREEQLDTRELKDRRDKPTREERSRIAEEQQPEVAEKKEG